MQRILMLGIHCRGLAIRGLGKEIDRDFPEEFKSANLQWAELVTQIDTTLHARQMAAGEDLVLGLWIPLSGFQIQDRKGAAFGFYWLPPIATGLYSRFS